MEYKCPQTEQRQEEQEQELFLALSLSFSIHDSCDLISGSSDGVNGDWNFSHSPFRGFSAEWLHSRQEGSTIDHYYFCTAQSVHTVWDQNRTDGSIKSQSAAESAAAKKRFLQIRSDALLRLFVSRQVDPASLPPTNRTHISKSDLGRRGIPDMTFSKNKEGEAKNAPKL